MSETEQNELVLDHLRPQEREILEKLIELGHLTANGRERIARLPSNEKYRGILRLLTMLGFVPEKEVARVASEVLGIPLVYACDFPLIPILEHTVNHRFLREFQILPLSDENNVLTLAVVDPLDTHAVNAIRLRTGKEVELRIGVHSEIESAIERQYGQASAVQTAGVGGASGGDADLLENDIEKLKDLASEAPVIRIVSQLIDRAVDSRASDIHLESFEESLRVRYRVDGTLRDIESPPNQYRNAIISRIKILARLNIAERRLPQDGRMKMAIRGISIDFRVSITPTLHGEGVVIRILDRSSVDLDLSSLGMSGAELTSYLRVLQQPHGILLATGPTGSGKTTTLYASLLQLHTSARKIITIEDPIEYQLDGINQIQVRPNIGLGFANILRSVLRHDPDIIMVGEIRDVDTAEIAVQAALTGHLVLSTLHTNNATSSITRLLDMGVQDFLLPSTLNGTIAQRLVRKLCTHCREPYTATPEIAEKLNLPLAINSCAPTLYRAKGCGDCHGTGFLGRTCISETLVMTDSIRGLILQRREAHELQRAAVREGMRTMYEDGMSKALSGITTIEEVLQVTSDSYGANPNADTRWMLGSEAENSESAHDMSEGNGLEPIDLRQFLPRRQGENLKETLSS